MSCINLFSDLIYTSAYITYFTYRVQTALFNVRPTCLADCEVKFGKKECVYTLPMLAIPVVTYKLT
jgi:hypothetical protein